MKRMFSKEHVDILDPFLLLDHFASESPDDYKAGFPMHPHRGIETVTYMLHGHVDHRDSLGNEGTIGPGDVQWMTAGSGILHEEMPRSTDGRLEGFQLWVNLPRDHKMMPPRYREIKRDEIPVYDPGRGSSVKVLAGEFQGLHGPVRDLVVNVTYLDVTLHPRVILEHEIPEERNAFVLVYEGDMKIGHRDPRNVSAGEVAVLGEGDTLRFAVGRRSVRFMYASAKPLREPIAWGGPIVMNTQEELDQAFSELKAGTFII